MIRSTFTNEPEPDFAGWLHNQFIGLARIRRPTDILTEVEKETRRLVFLRGTAEQEDHLSASLIGTLRKPSAPVEHAR